MGYESIGNFLNVNGLESGQNSFHNELIAYFKEAEKLIKEKNLISQRVPKSRHTLIKFIKDQLWQLDRSLGNVQFLYKSLVNFEKQNSKTATCRADKCRKTLNMILLGQAGLLDGQMHLTALQTNLRYLIESVRDIVSPNFRNQVFQHCRYIFSSYDHKEYDSLVKEYILLKTNKQLPTLNLDRKLLGLKIDVNNDNNKCDDRQDEEKIPEIPPAPTSIELQAAKQKLQMALTSSAAATGTGSPITSDDSIECYDNDDDNKSNDTKTISTAKNKCYAFIKETDSTTTTTTTSKQPSGSKDTKKRFNDTPVNDSLWKMTFKKLSQPMSVDKKASNNDGKDTTPSSIWSRKCMDCIEKINAKPYLLDGVKKYNFDLNGLERKAADNKLSYTHYRLLLNYCLKHERK